MEQAVTNHSRTTFVDDMRYERTVSRQLLTALRRGPLRPLIVRRNRDRLLLDVQLRRASTDPNHCWASVYVGLTTVLDVHERAGSFWLNAHPTHQANGGFDPFWSTPRPLADLSEDWAKVEAYLNKAISRLDGHHTDLEGKVHAAMCSGYPSFYRVINREASPSFASESARKALVDTIGHPLWDAVSAIASGERWLPAVRYSENGKPFGTSPDVLGLDDGGRLLVIEAKPPGALEGITWGPAQVRFYADMFAELFRRQPGAREHIRSMLEQRIALGLTSTGRTELSDPLRIVPVLAVGAGHASRHAIKRATMVQDAINEHVKLKAPVTGAEIWLLARDGERALVLR